MLAVPHLRQARRVLLLYPEFPVTYWGLQHSLPVLGRKAFMPPLGLITLAALCPPEFEHRLVDLNCRPLRDEDLEWAELVCISGMLIQKRSMRRLAERCRAAGKLVVAGGPYPTALPEEVQGFCDVVVTGEAEVTWPQFLADLEAGSLRALYRSDEKPDMQRSPTPRYDLLRVEDYLTIAVQFSRGCPFQCEFCDIIVMFGRRPRTKSGAQIRAELDAIRRTGFQGDIFFVDDNFIGDKRKALEIVETIRAWNAETGAPYEYSTEASLDLAQKPDLLAAMVAAGFRRVFLGIESPSAASLQETKKFQNLRASLEESVGTIVGAGLNVMAGFIIGFDSDPEEIAQLQIDLISRLPIPLAVVSRLEAAPGTPLWARMEAAGRLLPERADDEPGAVGNTNIAPLKPPLEALRDYRRVLEAIYAPEAYFARVRAANLRAPRPATLRARLRSLWRPLKISLQYSRGPLALLRFVRGLPPDFRRAALRLGLSLLWRRPDRLGLLMGYVALGNHVHRYTWEQVLPQLDEQLRALEAATPPQEPAPVVPAPRRPLPVAS